jgi:serine/threonine protein kinase
MQWYAGGDLKQWLDANNPAKRPVGSCKLVASDILSGVAQLHTHDIVHCDLKPSNVFLTAANRAF